MKLIVGDKVLYTKNERNLRRGMKKADFYKEASESTADISETINKYFTKNTTKKEIITKIVSIDKNYLGHGKHTYNLETGDFTIGKRLQYIPYNKTFANILDKAIEIESHFTKTGKLIIFNNIIILEYMKSSHNVWVDEQIGSLFNDDEKKLIDEEITRHFGRVKNIYYSLPFNKTIHIEQQQINNLINTI